MKFNVKINEEPKDVEIKLRGRDVDAIWKDIQGMYSDGKEDIGKMNTFREKVLKLAQEKTGLTDKDMGDMDIEDRQKLTNYIVDKTKKEIDFMSAS